MILGDNLRPLPPRRRSLKTLALLLLGLAMLVGWSTVWISSLQHNYLRGAQRTWVPAWGFVGLDFLANYHAARHWTQGGNPYLEPYNDPHNRVYAYPPILLPLFAWGNLLEQHAAVVVWTAALAGMFLLAGWCAWQSRRELGLSELPLPFVLAAVVCSTPVIFAMERGNCDACVLLSIAAACWLLQKRSRSGDATAGVVLAVAAWMKL
jgi:hypothetical protein